MKTSTNNQQHDLETAAKKMQSEYNRKWRQENPEKVKEYNQSYWIRKAQEAQSGKR